MWSASPREIARLPLSLLTRLRLILLGHEDLAGIVFWAALVGIGGALLSVLFRECAALLETMFTGQPGGLVHAASELPPLHRALVPLVGGVLSGMVLHLAGRVLTIPRAVDYMEAILVGDGRLGVRSTLVNSASSLLSIASGGSIGREGPMVQLAAMVGSRLGIIARAPVPRLRLMVACGGAAGIAAAYNAPISGALFVSEIVLGSTAMESFGPLVVASVTSSATIHKFLGYGPVFDVPRLHFGSNWELGFFVILGVLLGHLAPPFLALLDFAKSRFVSLGLKPYLQLGLGGLIVGCVSIFWPQVWGNGYSVVGEILNGQLVGLLLLAVLAAKVVATSATVGSGAVGGVFTPTLFIGSAVGALLGGVAHRFLPTFTSDPAVYALIGMGGFLAATTHAPLTSILMLFEMTADYQIVLPLMLACVTGHYTAKVYRRGESIYHGSLNRGVRAHLDTDDWRLKTVEALVKPATATILPSLTLQEMLAQLPGKPLERVYVVNSAGELVGWVDPRRILEEVNNRRLDGAVLVESVASSVTVPLEPDMPLGTALDAFLRENATVLPVTLGQWRNTLIGEVSRRDVLLAIQDRLTYPK